MTTLLDAGVNVVRINASHGTAEIRARWVEQLREVTRDRRDSVAVLVDLQGPRIRVGTLPQPLHLEIGQTVTFAPEAEAAGRRDPHHLRRTRRRRAAWARGSCLTTVCWQSR